MRRFLRYNGLTVVLLGCFLLSWAAQSLAGYRREWKDSLEHGEAPDSYSEYLRSDRFWEATAENWESEFFQMFMYVALTAVLYQKGSAESKDPDKPDDLPPPITPDSPWPARRGGWILKIYSHSLSLAFCAFFLVAFAIHALAGGKAYNHELRLHGQPEIPLLSYLATSQFWYESFQNWQSEFLAITAMVYLSIYLREKSSPESKPVQMPHRQNPE